MEAFKNRSAKVVIADPGSSTRLMMSSVLRHIGFTDSVAVATLSEAMPLLARGGVDWLITSLYPEEKVNGLHILALARQNQELENMKVSLFAGDTELVFLSRAFSLGLLSAHHKPFAQAEFTEEIEGVLKHAEQQNWNDTLTSAVYVRKFLKAGSSFQSLMQFEAALVQRFPYEAKLLLDQSEAHFLAGDFERGSALLWHAGQRDPDLAAAARTLGEKYRGEDTVGKKNGVSPGVCVVVDPDSTALTNIKTILEASAAKEVHAFADGASAWDWLKEHEPPDLLIMEWRIPKVTGPVLLQRLRSTGMYLPLVIVNSSLVGKKDQPLLEEMGVSTIIEKPTTRSEYLSGLAWTVNQARRPTELSAMESQIRAHLLAEDLDAAASLMQLYLSKSKNSNRPGSDASELDAGRRRLEAEFAFHLGDYATAKGLAMASLQLGGKSVITLNLLGKALMKLNDFAAAMKVFERASEISPNSVERLCATAEVQCALGDNERAMETLDKATKIDGENQVVINTTVNLALATGNAAMAKEVFDDVKPSDSVLAYINNRAVAYAKAGNFKESIELYMNALAAIPEDKNHVRSIVLYNLALAEIQKGDLEAAIIALKKIGSDPDAGFAAKIASLLKRAEAALKDDRPLKLNQRDAAADLAVNPAVGKFAAVLQQFKGEPSDGASTFCCYGIYRETGESDPLVETLLEHMPRLGDSRGKPA